MSIFTRWPFSNRPGPTASTSPWVGFSLAVSGMYSGPRMASASSAGRITTRSSRGWILILGLALVAVDMVHPPYCEEEEGGLSPPPRSRPTGRLGVSCDLVERRAGHLVGIHLRRALDHRR